ncbi:MAG: hypothetical protein ACHQNE_05200 [Candidatus Kapaibacterium sp.]
MTPNLKYILPGAFFLMAIALAAVTSNSCSRSRTAEAQVNAGAQIGDTIHLVSLSPLVAFHSDSVVDSIPIWLSCSCRSTLATLGSGGDVSAFEVTSRTPDTTWIIPHYLRVAKLPGSQNHLRAWYAFSAVDHFGQTDYDTLRVTYDY